MPPQEIKIMAIIVSLKDIVEALEMGTQTAENILDPATGEVILVTDDDELEIEDPDDDMRPEWQVEHLNKVRKLLKSKKVLRLPNSYDINEWSIMEEFCYTIENAKQREILLDSIRGKGAFQRFRETLDRFVLNEDWSSFRQSALQKIVRDWLEENKIAYKE
jgi:hypothetical protein